MNRERIPNRKGLGYIMGASLALYTAGMVSILKDYRTDERDHGLAVVATGVGFSGLAGVLGSLLTQEDDRRRYTEIEE